MKYYELEHIEHTRSLAPGAQTDAQGHAGAVHRATGYLEYIDTVSLDHRDMMYQQRLSLPLDYLCDDPH